jgi:SecD/SecF fusion protein
VLIALSHDLLITAGVYALVDRELTTATVAALLTILGFSLYDTIIVFDRIRENVPRMPRATFSQIVNRSMSEVIVRSLATSFVSVLPVLSLLLFGGETLQDFAFALLVGTISGTYSSVFIASQVLAHWKEREPVYRRAARWWPPSTAAPCPPTRRRARAARRSTSTPAARAARRAGSRRRTTRTARSRARSSTRWCATWTSTRRPRRAPPSRSATAPRTPIPSEVFMKDDPAQRRAKERKPRNRKHGRSR